MSTSRLVRIHKNTKLFSKDFSSVTISFHCCLPDCFSPPETAASVCQKLQSTRNCYFSLPETQIHQKLLLLLYYQIASVCQKLLPPVRQKLLLLLYYQISSVCQKLLLYYCYWTIIVNILNHDFTGYLYG